MAKTKQKIRYGKPETYSTGPIGGPMTVIQVTPAKQCPAKHRLFHDCECQGVYGHTGPHWCYLPNGDLQQWQSKKDIKNRWDWASSITPAGNENYPDPVKQQRKYFRSFNKTKKVGTEPAEPIDAKTQKILDDFKRRKKRTTKKAKKSGVSR